MAEAEEEAEVMTIMEGGTLWKRERLVYGRREFASVTLNHYGWNGDIHKYGDEKIRVIAERVATTITPRDPYKASNPFPCWTSYAARWFHRAAVQRYLDYPYSLTGP